MAWYDEDENPWDVWLSQHFPGIFAHPNSPAGGTGYGASRKPGVLECDPSPWNVPHPKSPAGRYITPAEAASEYLTFEFEKARARVRASSTWEGLRVAAERALGPQSFGLGACYGFVKNPAMSVGQLIQLQRIFIEADLYDQLTRQSPWWKRALLGTMTANPGGVFLAVALVKAGKISPDDLKRSYEMREALIKEVGHIFAHPGDFFANLKDEIKASYLDKWTRFTALHTKIDLKSQFEAGEIFGDVLMDVVMLILTVVSGVGAARQAAAQAAKLTARLPQLTRVSEYIRGIRVAETGTADGAALARTPKGASMSPPAEAPSGGISPGRKDVPSKVSAARLRQEQMLKDDVGYNISPTEWDNYPSIGRNGTFLTDKQAVTDALGDISGKTHITLTRSEVARVETGSGLVPGSLQNGFNVRKVTGLSNGAPRSPLEGNQFFLGPGNHLPSGAPEMIVKSIPTTDNAFTTTLLEVKVVP